MLIAGYVYNRRQMMAGVSPGAVPLPLVIHAFLMDYCIAGLAAGATKG